MERSRTHRHRQQRYCNTSTEESEYDVVDDQEEVLNVRILPARPLNDMREYADRDLPRSSSAQSLSGLSTANSHIRTREMPPISGPAINRDLKPGRRKIRLDKRFPPVQPGNQRPNRPSPSPPPQAPSDLVNHLPALSLREPCRRDGQKATKKAVSPCTKSPRNTENVSAPQANQRRSLDLETHDIEKWLQHKQERRSSKHHHEWPQTKEDFDQNVFVPMEKPQQTYYEEDWYVGACNRAEAEHALHLVNKDGAFLVRDCSINTDSEPLVLAVYHEKKVFNVKIRFIESTCKFALGTGQRSNDMFDSVADIIKFHSIFPIILISGRCQPGSKYPENCVLTCPVTKRDVDQLLQ